MQSVIVPLITDKTGNLSDITNYRAIAVSTAFSNLFESVVEASLIFSSITDKYQFGFKPGHSTGLCTGVFNKKAVLPQGNRAMPQVFFSVEVRQ